MLAKELPVVHAIEKLLMSVRACVYEREKERERYTYRRLPSNRHLLKPTYSDKKRIKKQIKG